jgi:preprotein translocase subunit SecA
MVMIPSRRVAPAWLASLWRGSDSASSAPDQALIGQVRRRAAAQRGLTDDRLTAAARTLAVSMREKPDRCSAEQTAEAFALACEAVRRVHGYDLYDVQILGGMLLCRGMVAELGTGEGKTLLAALPAVYFALCGQGVHVATPNAYLAGRDYELLSPVYRLLGCSSGLLIEHASMEEKRIVYAYDIVYGTGYEFGFDYLREQLARIAHCRGALGQHFQDILHGAAGPDPGLHARRNVAVIDEADSVLIDEACIPLIISEGGAPDEGDAGMYAEALRVAEQLREDADFVLDREAHSVTLTKSGKLRCHAEAVGLSSGGLQRSWSVYVEQALQAKLLMTRDIDYVIAEGKIVLVDGSTGRLCPDRTWSEGLHQILEMKENLTHSGELHTAARITRQRFFRMYDTLCGMTGTAVESRREFWKAYRLRVATVPYRLPLRRQALPPRYFIDGASKWRSAVQEIARIHATGRPVLIGSRTIENSETLARQLDEAGVPYQLLNGKQTADEADVVARAGHRGAVTIATNMAGRGTDIKLEPGVADLGGLHLIAVEPNESLRIDRQLIGRVGRQGDPGSHQFFVSADDALLLRFGPSLSRKMKSMPHCDGELAVDLSRQVRAVQRRSEAAGYRQRSLLKAADRWRTDELVNLVK